MTVMKIKMKMKNRSREYDKNRPTRWQGHKQTKYKVSQYDEPYM